MTVDVFIISRYDEKERPYVSTTCPTPERIKVLEANGYQIHVSTIIVLTVSDFVKQADELGARGIGSDL